MKLRISYELELNDPILPDTDLWPGCNNLFDVAKFVEKQFEEGQISLDETLAWIPDDVCIKVELLKD